MTLTLIFLLVVMKVPLAFCAWMLWRAGRDSPDQIFDGGDGGICYSPGPRTRGPHSGPNGGSGSHRRRDAAHADRQPVTTAMLGDR